LHGELEDIRFKVGGKAFTKTTFGSRELAAYLSLENEKQPIERIELVGLCTDICVISNALLLKAFLPETEIAVDASCCAGVTPESHARSLEAMRACHIDIL
ncbi:MAG: cysteine hydrolase, partial [Clostridiales Family XIII bacterium]|jgi:nicotinamidase-related amidase|nr:cysteine hydrolase [Clostridiales Family XIII bacterium]